MRKETVHLLAHASYFEGLFSMRTPGIIADAQHATDASVTRLDIIFPHQALSPPRVYALVDIQSLVPPSNLIRSTLSPRPSSAAAC